MTYGSQAAAASQVFAQQRDLALHDRAGHQLRLVEEALARIDAAPTGRASVAAARSRPNGSKRCPGRRIASTASVWPTGSTDDGRPNPGRDRGDGARRTRRHRGRRRATPRGHAAHAARRLRAAGGADVPEGRIAAAHRRVQAAWRVCRDRLAVPRQTVPAASSPTRRATTPRASPGRLASSARRRSW